MNSKLLASSDESSGCDTSTSPSEGWVPDTGGSAMKASSACNRLPKSERIRPKIWGVSGIIEGLNILKHKKREEQYQGNTNVLFL